MKNLPLAAAAVFALLNSAAGQGPTIRVVNAGSLLPNALSPGTRISILGTNLTNTTASAPDQLSPSAALGGVSVKIAGVAAPLFYVSPGLISAQIDPSTPVGTATLTVSSPTVNAGATVNIQATAAPGVLTWSDTGDRDGLIFNLSPFGQAPFSVTSGGAPTDVTFWTTGLDLSTAPAVTIGGLAAAVQSSGSAGCCLGLQQISVELPAALAGAGRVELLVTSGNNVSNAVETVVLPNVGQGPFPPTAENAARNREIGAMVYIPATGRTLVLDESDDVIRVIDMKQRAVVRTIALASGAQPFAIAVNDAGTQAVVAERGRARVAFVDLGRGIVISEIPVDAGPAAVAIDGDIVLVASEDGDTVSAISLVTKQVRAVLPVGRSPRSIAVDDANARAYVANENGGSISVIDMGNLAVTGTIDLGANARPAVVRLVPNASMLAISEPAAGVADTFDLTSKTKATTRTMIHDILFTQDSEYVINQVAGTGTVFSLVPPGSTAPVSVTPLKLEPGVRSLAVDAFDHLLLVSSESSGTILLLDLTTYQAAGSINAVRSENESTAARDRSDHDHAANIPVITSINPPQAAAGSIVQVVVAGSNLGGVYDVFFAGAGGAGRDGNFSIMNATPDSTGQSIVLTVTIAAGAAKGDHLLRVFTPNGESTTVAAAGNVLTVN